MDLEKSLTVGIVKTGIAHGGDDAGAGSTCPRTDRIYLAGMEQALLWQPQANAAR